MTEHPRLDVPDSVELAGVRQNVLSPGHGEAGCDSISVKAPGQAEAGAHGCESRFAGDATRTFALHVECAEQGSGTPQERASHHLSLRRADAGPIGAILAIGLAKTRDLDPHAWSDLLASTRVLGLGATEAYPGFFPEGLGITKRTVPRNQLLGTVMTRPEPFVVVLGVSWFDSDPKDMGDNEDMHVVNEETMQITPMSPTDFAKRYPEYVPHHRTVKAYLRKPEI